ncbi:MAG: hypothetical protein HPY76_08340 [Anaerolineae bacterium]|nr:hypothetical protein [Anaerolineae bacterium]
MLPFSNIDLISPGNATPPWLFGDEPAHTWCYFFQKAELARQNHDWDEINRLGDEAEAGGWQASQPAEYLPFLEAAARAGNLQDVRRWHERIMNTAGDAGAICAFWLRAGADEPLVPAMQELAAQASTDLGCGQ